MIAIEPFGRTSPLASVTAGGAMHPVSSWWPPTSPWRGSHG